MFLFATCTSSKIRPPLIGGNLLSWQKMQLKGDSLRTTACIPSKLCPIVALVLQGGRGQIYLAGGGLVPITVSQRATCSE